MKKLVFIFLVSIFLSLAMRTAYSQLSITYQYDDLNRLTRADYGNGTIINYTYDANGNRLTETTNSGSFVNA